MIGDRSIRVIAKTKEGFAQSETRHGWRRKRMVHMLGLIGLPHSANVIDIGGTPEIWRTIPHDFQVTLVNLPGSISPEEKLEGYTFIEHDACDMDGLFPDNAFDFAFSNSTIEHVGDESRQEMFAREVRRLAPSYWVQTPSDRFPFEVHTWVPFYWSLPDSMKERLKQRWRRRLPAWSEMIEGTRVLTEARMQSLFPDAKVFKERLLGFEKSYSFYKPHQAAR